MVASECFEEDGNCVHDVFAFAQGVAPTPTGSVHVHVEDGGLMGHTLAPGSFVV